MYGLAYGPWVSMAWLVTQVHLILLSLWPYLESFVSQAGDYESRGTYLLLMLWWALFEPAYLILMNWTNYVWLNLREILDLSKYQSSISCSILWHHHHDVISRVDMMSYIILGIDFVMNNNRRPQETGVDVNHIDRRHRSNLFWMIKGSTVVRFSSPCVILWFK